MIKVSKYERKELERVGLLKDRRVGLNPQDANYTVTNREHVGRDKTIYVAEEPEIMLFLGKYDELNLQRISTAQYKKLTDKKILTNENTQFWGEYKVNAICFQDSYGVYRCKKISKIMLELGIWSNNKTKNNYKPNKVVESHTEHNN